MLQNTQDDWLIMYIIYANFVHKFRALLGIILPESDLGESLDFCLKAWQTTIAPSGRFY